MYYANYDANTGEILGFYCDELHSEIPKPNIELTEDEWQTALSGSYRVINGRLQEYTPTEPDLTTDEKISQTQGEYEEKLKNIRDLYEAALLSDNNTAAESLKLEYISTIDTMANKIGYLLGEEPLNTHALPESEYCPVCAARLIEGICPRCRWRKY